VGEEARREMDTVVGLRWLQIGDRPFSIIRSSDSNRHVNVVTAEASESIVLLVLVSRVQVQETCVAYLPIGRFRVFWVLQRNVVMGYEIERALTVF
jgi:hypothetical protein